MAYNPNIRLNPDQLALIEDALRAEIGRLAKPGSKNWNEVTPKHEAAREIRELLGHIHNQKAWYQPEDNVPLG